eukprot:jgi/Ulvmu1/7977/UM004_0210.1
MLILTARSSMLCTRKHGGQIISSSPRPRSQLSHRPGQDIACSSRLSQKSRLALVCRCSSDGEPQAAPGAAVPGSATESGPEKTDLRTYPRRRWSNLNRSLQHSPGSLIGSATLIAGTTIGAGILALPAATKEAGFGPSCVTLVGFYMFSAISGLFLTEVNINTVCELGGGAVSLQSMVKRTLGDTGATVASAAYIFLHYALLVAYISRAGGSIASVAGLPEWVSAAVFTALLGGFCYASSPRLMDVVNIGLLVLVVASFLGLVAVAFPGVHFENLEAASWPSVIETLPVVALAFVYQNVVPVVVTNLEGDVTRVRLAVWTGLAIPLLMFIGWEAAMLGSVVPGSAGADPVMILRDQNAVVAPLIEGFSLLAIATSFIGFVLGLSDFFLDALSLSNANRVPAYVLTLLPPYVFALAFPDVFFQALDLAGTYGVLVLFGVMPAAMVFSERNWGSTISSIRVVPGGQPLIFAIGGTASLIIGNEVVHAVGARL